MKVFSQFAVICEDNQELYNTLRHLEESIELARKVFSNADINGKAFKPIKFLEHDYDLILGDFGIDFLHRQDAARIGNQTNP